MAFETRVTKLLGIQHPIVAGGMTGVGDWKFASAVSKTGCLGVFAAHNAGDPENIRTWCENIRKETSNPFGVNITILPSVDPIPYDEYARVIIESGVKIVETAGNNPKKWIPLFKKAGLICIHKCTTIRHALTAQRLGADIISLDGFECAGHPGEDDIANFVLQAKGAKALKVPYICSGGVGDGKQLTAALALGADGVNLGTRFCATKECNWPDSYKLKMVESDERQTVLLFRKFKNTARVFKNKAATEAINISNAKGKDLEFPDIAHLVNGKRGRQAEKDGDADAGIWSAGQVVGLIDSIPTCQELVDIFMKEALVTLQVRLQSLIKPKL